MPSPSMNITYLILDGFKNALITTFPVVIKSTWYIWVLVGFLLLIRLSIFLYKWNRFRKSGITQIDKMSGEEFELYLAQLFSKLGFNVEHVGQSSDFGADLVIEKDRNKTVIQAKRQDSNVGEYAIQEVFASKAHYHASSATVVTNSNFTNQARILARENGVQLVDRNGLVSLIMSNN